MCIKVSIRDGNNDTGWSDEAGDGEAVLEWAASDDGSTVESVE